MKNVTLSSIIIVIILAPLVAWKYIDDLQVKFTLALFIIVMTGIFLFFNIQGILMPQEEKTKYRWVQLLLILVLIYLFGSYSFKLFDVIKEIR